MESSNNEEVVLKTAEEPESFEVRAEKATKDINAALEKYEVSIIAQLKPEIENGIVPIVRLRDAKLYDDNK